MWLQDSNTPELSHKAHKTRAEIHREYTWFRLPGTTPLPFPAILNGTAREAQLRDRSIFSEVKLQAELMRCT